MPLAKADLEGIHDLHPTLLGDLPNCDPADGMTTVTDLPTEASEAGAGLPAATTVMKFPHGESYLSFMHSP